MKKISILIISIIIALLIGGFAGYMIGKNSNKGIEASVNTNTNVGVSAEQKAVGTYKTNTWNGKEAVLVLNEDKTCIYPTGDKGTWYVEGNTIYFELSTSQQQATIVDKGLMINTHFFQKL